MKKRILIIAILLIIISLFIINHNNIVYTEIDNVKYAIYVNGEPVTTFPIGEYKVDVNCTNAYGYWDNTQKKIIISRISDNVTCNVDFNSKNNSDYLNNYILGLTNNNEGDGKLIHEIINEPNYTNAEIINLFGTTPAYFRNTSNANTTQTETGDYWTFNSSTGLFTSDPSKFTASGTNNYYHVYFKIPDAGYYQICYTINQSTNTNNRLYAYKNNTQIININSSTSAQVGENCQNLGYFEENDYVNISEYGYSGTSSPIITFRIETTENIDEIDTGYRYEGKNPNNYIMFNNELWRIIGVFDESSHGQTNKYLVKIIRNESIGSFAWYAFYNNDWSTSTLQKLLNEQYYDWETNKSTVSNNCHFSYTTPATCDFSRIGINDNYRNMIKNVTWYLGGAGKNGYIDYRPIKIYSYERDENAVYNARNASFQGYIGLMYESDFLLSPLSSNCSRTKLHNNYGDDNCAGKSWISYGDEWVIDPKSNSSSEAWYIYNNGYMIGQSCTNTNMVRPVLYLSEDIYRVAGTGKITDPYIIGLGTN